MQRRSDITGYGLRATDGAIGSIMTQTALPEAETAPMLFWALLASGQIVKRKVDGWEKLAERLSATSLDLAA